MTSVSAYVLRVSESRSNYWATYVVDLSLMSFFVLWDSARLHVGGAVMGLLFVLGAFSWTLSEYAFHRWMYHMGIPLTVNAHDKHHQDPTAYIAMPWFVTPLLFLPPQQLVAGWLGMRGFSTFLAGWFAGYIAYSYMHHSLHHYKLSFAWYRHLQSQHRIHHAFPETNYGVTMRYWDRVFGTEFRKKQ